MNLCVIHHDQGSYMCFVYILSQALQYLYKHTLVDREIHIIYQIVYIFKYIHLDAIDRYQRLQHIFNMISLICLNTYLHVIFENYIRLLYWRWWMKHIWRGKSSIIKIKLISFYFVKYHESKLLKYVFS